MALSVLGTALGAGDLLLVTGGHGSGKTTLLAGLAKATGPGTSGVTRLVPAEPILQPDTTVADHGDPADPRWSALLERLGLSEHAAKLPFMLSRGTATRLQLAQAVWVQPDNLLLDEPFNGLDQRGRALLVALVGELLAAGTCVVVATHESGGLATLPHRVLTLPPTDG